MHKSMRQMGFITWCWESCEDTVGKSWQPAEVSGDGEKANVRVFLRKGKKEDPENYKLLSLNFQSLERLWSRSSGKMFPGTQRTTEWFGTDSRYLPRSNHALPTCFSSMMRWLSQWTRAEQQVLTSGRLLTQCPYDQMGQILTAEVDSKVG